MLKIVIAGIEKSEIENALKLTDVLIGAEFEFIFDKKSLLFPSGDTYYQKLREF